MIATFSPPIKATAGVDSLPRILIGMGAEPETGSPYLIAVDGDGNIGMMMLTDVTVDWRYDPKSELWNDVNGADAAPFGDSDG